MKYIIIALFSLFSVNLQAQTPAAPSGDYTVSINGKVLHYEDTQDSLSAGAERQQEEIVIEGQGYPVFLSETGRYFIVVPKTGKTKDGKPQTGYRRHYLNE